MSCLKHDPRANAGRLTLGRGALLRGERLRRAKPSASGAQAPRTCELLTKAARSAEGAL